MQWRETSAAHRVFGHGPGLAVRQGVQGIVRAAALSDGERDGEHDVVVARRRFAEFRPRVEVREHGVEIHWSSKERISILGPSEWDGGTYIC